MKFCPFLFQKIDVYVALIHNVIFEFKLCFTRQNNFFISPKNAIVIVGGLGLVMS